jgi:hypothetical protein
VLAWLFLILALVVAAVLLVWMLVIGVVVVGGVASTELCPRCGVSLGIDHRDRFLDPRHHSRAKNRCLRCGWRRSDD